MNLVRITNCNQTKVPNKKELRSYMFRHGRCRREALSTARALDVSRQVCLLMSSQRSVRGKFPFAYPAVVMVIWGSIVLPSSSEWRKITVANLAEVMATRIQIVLPSCRLVVEHPLASVAGRMALLFVLFYLELIPACEVANLALVHGRLLTLFTWLAALQNTAYCLTILYLLNVIFERNWKKPRIIIWTIHDTNNLQDNRSSACTESTVHMAASISGHGTLPSIFYLVTVASARQMKESVNYHANYPRYA